MKEFIYKLMVEGLRVTCHDNGTTSANFILAVVIDGPIDIWYIAATVGAEKYAADVVGNLLVFPGMPIDKEVFEFICANS